MMDSARKITVSESSESIKPKKDKALGSTALGQFSPESPLGRTPTVFSQYAERFRRSGRQLNKTYLSRGVAESIKKGLFNTDPDYLLTRGFFSKEDESIHDKIDPEDTNSEEVIRAEALLRSQIHRLILDDELDRIPSEMCQKALYDGSISAILTGATTTGPSGEKVTFSIPSRKSAEATEFMQNAGIDFKDDGIRSLSYHGFINILEAIKDKPQVTEKGFQALDWYFDNFNYQDNYGEFLDKIGGYIEEADLAFKEKYDDYMETKKEQLKTKEIENKEDLLSELKEIANADKIPREELFAYLDEKILRSSNAELFQFKDKNNPAERSSISSNGDWPNEREKCVFAKHKITEIIDKYDQSADFSLGQVFDYSYQQDEQTGEVKKIKKGTSREYVIVRFGANEYNNVIVIPIDDTSAAMFDWRGKTGDDAEAWRTIFKNTSIRTRDASISRRICNGYSKLGPIKSLNNEWDRVEKDLDIELSDYVL